MCKGAQISQKSVLADPRESKQLLSKPEKFLLFASLALNSLMAFSGGPTFIGACLLIYTLTQPPEY